MTTFALQDRVARFIASENLPIDAASKADLSSQVPQIAILDLNARDQDVVAVTQAAQAVGLAHVARQPIERAQSLPVACAERIALVVGATFEPSPAQRTLLEALLRARPAREIGVILAGPWGSEEERKQAVRVAVRRYIASSPANPDAAPPAAYNIFDALDGEAIGVWLTAAPKNPSPARVAAALLALMSRIERELGEQPGAASEAQFDKARALSQVAATQKRSTQLIDRAGAEAKRLLTLKSTTLLNDLRNPIGESKDQVLDSFNNSLAAWARSVRDAAGALEDGLGAAESEVQLELTDIVRRAPLDGASAPRIDLGASASSQALRSALEAPIDLSNLRQNAEAIAAAKIANSSNPFGPLTLGGAAAGGLIGFFALPVGPLVWLRLSAALGAAAVGGMIGHNLAQRRSAPSAGVSSPLSGNQLGEAIEAAIAAAVRGARARAGKALDATHSAIASLPDPEISNSHLAQQARQRRDDMRSELAELARGS